MCKQGTSKLWLQGQARERDPKLGGRKAGFNMQKYQFCHQTHGFSPLLPADPQPQLLPLTAMLTVVATLTPRVPGTQGTGPE